MELYHRFVKLLSEDGVRVIPRGLWYLSTAHTEKDVELTVRAAESALWKL
jgi:glutamate-1-semialdehyde 2,1-aminomutase